MKRILFFIFSLAASAFLSAQTADKWEQVYGGSGTDYGYSVKSCLDQGYIVAGTSSTAGISDGYVVRTDSLGLVMWSKYYIGNNVDVLRSIRLLPDSGFVMAGYSNSQGNGGYDGWAIRTDKNGDTLWTRYIGTPDWDFFYDVYPTWDSGFVFSGGTYGLGNGDEDMYFVKLDKNGNTVWTKTYGGTKTDEARGIVETSDSMLAACGFSHSLGDSLGDSWILRMDMNGDTVWTRTTGQTTSADKAWGIGACNPYQRIYVVGETFQNGNSDAYIHCVSFSGALIFDVVSGLAPQDVYYGIVVRNDASTGVIGTTFSYGGGYGDMWFFKDYNGWTVTTYGTLQADGGYGIDFTHDGGYISCGFTEGYNSVLPNVYLVKADSTGYSTGLLGIQDQPTEINPLTVSVYPNPSGDACFLTLASANPLQGDLQLNLFDMAGRAVTENSTAEWTIQNSRTANCRLDVHALPEGIYLYTVSDENGFRHSGKLIISR